MQKQETGQVGSGKADRNTQPTALCRCIMAVPLHYGVYAPRALHYGCISA